MKLNKEAIDEITYLLNEVKDVVRLLEEFGIHIYSDSWSAMSINQDKEDILNWKRKDFEQLQNINIGEKFFIGGNIVTGSQHQYKDKWITAPKELAEIQSKIFKKYLNDIIKTTSLKHFTLKLSDPYGLIDNCGWEHCITIDAKVKESALKDNTISEYLKEIDEEWDDCTCVYKALSLVLATQEQDKWDNIYRYITNIIKTMDNENGYSAKTIRDEIRFRKTHESE